jgi:amino acid adenylation domain-containing protein
MTTVAEQKVFSFPALHGDLVHPWNDTARDYPPGWCAHQLVEAQARRTPDATAVSCGTARLTYRELDARANQAARLLRRRGVGPDVLVGVYMERSLELIVGMLGVLKAGGAYVPLDPAYPRARVQLMLADTCVPVLLTQPALAGRVEVGSAAVVAIDGSWSALEGESADPVESGVDPENLSHVIYTSGSTGIPKGVQIRHFSVATLIRWAPEVLGIGDGTSVLASTSVCFDVHVAETWVPLSLGARIVIVPNALHLASLPEGEHVDVASMVPSAAAELLKMDGIPHTIRSLNLGGEPLRNPLAQDLYRALPNLQQVINLYGPTEDTTYSTYAIPPRGSERTMPVGYPVANTQVYILDPGYEPVSHGENGEIWIGGAGLSRGYLRRPAATAEKFVPDPFSAIPGARMYRTGDIGRAGEDGQIDCLGRIDHQVKVRGYRVELGEVEEALRRHPAVTEAAATVREDVPGDRVLVGYVVAEDGVDPSAAELKAFLKDRLPEYMVPTFIESLGALPRLPNGKVDRGALPAPRIDVERAYTAPRTPVEDAVCRIWAEVVGVERVGVEDDFFELGGHSLRATQVVSRLRQAFGVQLAPFIVFELRTPAELARAVERGGAEVDGIPLLEPADRNQPIPLSSSQKAIWFFQELSPGMRSYNFQAAIRFRGRLDVPALERALTEIVRRHEIFRTTFRAIDGEPRQLVQEPWSVMLPVADLRNVVEEAREKELERILRDEFLKPFHLGELPLIRWTLYRTTDDEHVLAAVEHHFVHDGWSFGVFLRELAALYAAFTQGQPSPLEPLELQFADYAVWQRRWMQSPEAMRQLDYWKRQLAGLPPVLELPTDHPRPAEMSFQGRSLRYRLPPELAVAAQEFSRKHGVTLYVTLMAAYQALLHRYTGATDFAVGGGVANRNDRAAEQVIGMIVNTVALRADVAGDPTGDELLRRVRDVTFEAYAHREIPFGEVVEAVQPARRLSHLPIYQTAFSFHDAPYPPFALPGARMEVTEALSNESAKFDLQVIVIPRGSQQAGADDQVTMLWEYATDLFERDTVVRMEEHYRSILRAIIADPSTRVSALPLLAPEERARVVEGWNATGADYAVDAPVHTLVEARADAAPDALAVAGDGFRLSYAELDRAANRIANALIARGVRRGEAVAVCMERSPELAAALLGVLKAGAAYVPVDPAYPADRIGFMLRDTAAPVVVAQVALAERVAGFGIPVLAVDGRARMAEDASDARPAVRVDADDLAYVIYTSGSTGRPKGVMVEHRALANLCGWHAAAFGVTEADRATLVAGVGFDASAWETWPYLVRGASLHVPADELRTAPAELRDWLVERGITIGFLPTPLAESVLPLAWPASTPLRAMLVGGDRLRSRPSPSLPFTLVNNYGPTENTVVATSGAVPAAGEGLPTIGRPIANTAAYVLDGYGNPVPAGVPGELFVGGAQVARGYLGRPALTAERFIPDPFPAVPGARMYATGDRVRWRESASVRECVSALVGDSQGTGDEQRSRPSFTHALTHPRTHALEFLGRTDLQVKVRGFRIEPGEVEAALRTHPAVTDAVCVARAEEGGAPRLLAWVVAGDADASLPAQLRAHLRERLPEYMVPAAIGTVAAIPLTSNGKTDTAALPTPDAARVEAVVSVPPRTEEERTLARIFAGLLRVPAVGVFDNFFDLGGDSTLSIQLVSRAREAGLHVTTRQVFQHQTVAALAAAAVPAALPEPEDAVPAFSGAGLDAAELDDLLYALDQEGLA